MPVFQKPLKYVAVCYVRYFQKKKKRKKKKKNLNNNSIAKLKADMNIISTKEYKTGMNITEKLSSTFTKEH